MIPPNLYIYALLAFAGLLIGGTGAWKVMDWRCKAARTEAVERTIEQMRLVEEQNDAISTRFEDDRVKVRTEFRTIYEAVDSTPGPSSADCRFPVAWVWAWHAANKGVASGEPDRGVPYATYPDERGAEGDVPESHLGGAGVPRVQGEAQGAERLGKGWFE